MGVMSIEDYQSQQGTEEQPAQSGVMSVDDYQASSRVEPPQQEESSFWGDVGDLAMEGINYISNPEKDSAALTTHNIVKDKARVEIDKMRKADHVGAKTPTLDNDYIFSLTQEMMDKEGIAAGDSVKVLRELQKRTGQQVGAKESQLVRRYIKDPDTRRGIGPGDALVKGAMNLGAGLTRTGGGMGAMAGEGMEAIGLEQAGQGLQEVSKDVSAWSDAYLDIDKENAGTNVLGEAGAMAPLMATPGGVLGGAAVAGGTGAGYLKGQGATTPQSLAAGAVDATLVGGINRIVKGIQGGQVTADELAKKGIKALDKRLILTDKRDLIKRIEATTGKSADQAIKDTAEYMKTINAEALNENQVVRMVTQHMTGGEDFSPRAGKYLGKAESLDSSIAPKVMQEAQSRVDDIKQGINNPKLQEMVDSFTVKNGNFEAIDWNGLYQGMKDMGLPVDGPLMKKVESYKSLDDVTLVNQMQGANPVSGKNVSSVGQRGDWGAQAEAEYMDKIRQFVYSHIPGVNVDEKVVRSIIRSTKKPGITPKRLKKDMVEAGANVSGLTDEALQELIDTPPDVGYGKPVPRMGNATEPDRVIPLMDEAEVDEVLNRNRELKSGEDYEATARAEMEPTMDSIIQEFSSHGDKLDEVLQAGMDKGLKGKQLREFIRFELKGSDDVSPDVVESMRPGFINSGVAVQAGSSAAGAATGAAVAPEGQKLEGALMGATVGATAGSKMGRKAIGDKIEDALFEHGTSKMIDNEGTTTKAQLEAFWGGTEMGDPKMKVLTKYKDADPKMLNKAVEMAEEFQKTDPQMDIDAFVGDFLRARDARYKNPELISSTMKQVNEDLSKVTNEYEVNPMSIPATYRLEADMTKNQADQISFYEGAEQMYMPKIPNKVEEPGWSQDPKVIMRIEQYVADEDDMVFRATRGGEDLLDDLIAYPQNFEGTIYRGSRLKGPQKLEFDNLNPGDILTNSHHLSTSTSPSVGASFADEPKYLNYHKIMGKDESELRHPFMITTKSKGHDIAPHADIDEDEVILGKDKWFRVLDKREGSMNHMLIEEIPEDEVASLSSQGIKPNADILKLIGSTGAVGGAASQIENVQQ